MKNDEKDIIAKAQQGDEAAFTDLVKLHQREVHLLALRLLGNHEEALDVSQLAFMQAYKGLKNFRGEASLSTWLYRITYNLCMRRLKTAKWKRFMALDENITDDRPSSDSPYKETERAEFKQNLQSALEHLPPKMRAVFTMHQIQGLKMAEIAEITGKTTGNIKALHYHAIRKLREALKEWKHAEFSAP